MIGLREQFAVTKFWSLTRVQKAPFSAFAGAGYNGPEEQTLSAKQADLLPLAAWTESRLHVHSRYASLPWPA